MDENFQPKVTARCSAPNMIASLLMSACVAPSMARGPREVTAQRVCATCREKPSGAQRSRRM